MEDVSVSASLDWCASMFKGVGNQNVIDRTKYE